MLIAPTARDLAAAAPAPEAASLTWTLPAARDRRPGIAAVVIFSGAACTASPGRRPAFSRPGPTAPTARGITAGLGPLAPAMITSPGVPARLAVPRGVPPPRPAAAMLANPGAAQTTAAVSVLAATR